MRAFPCLSLLPVALAVVALFSYPTPGGVPPALDTPPVEQAPVVEDPPSPGLFEALDGQLSPIVPNEWNALPHASVQFGPPDALTLPVSMWDSELLERLERAAHNVRMEKSKGALEKAPHYQYGATLVPAITAVPGALFDTPLDPRVDMGRISNLLRAQYTHTHTQPAGWQQLVDAVRNAHQQFGAEQAARLANSLINQIPYVDGTDGTFFAPARFFGRGGVCKDYVTTKYLLLVEAGFSEDDLRIVVVAPSAHAPERSNAHVMLALRIDGKPWILDMANSMELNADIRKVDASVKARVQQLSTVGITRLEYLPHLDNMVPVEQFGTTMFGRNRGLEWVGNAKGGAYFGRPSSASVQVVQFGTPGSRT